MLFTKAFFLGWMVAIPVGPVAFLILQRSLSVGQLAGIASGLGAALADALLGLLAALGLVALLEQLESYHHFLRPVGSIVLLIVGVYFYFRKPPHLETAEVLSQRFLHHYLWDALSVFFVTLLNPLTIIAFTALFVGSDLIPEERRHIQYVEIALGVFSGSFFWWTTMACLAQSVKKRLSPLFVHRLFQGIGVVLISLALFSLLPRLTMVIERFKGFLSS